MTSTLGGLTVTLSKKLRQSDDFLKAKHNLLTQFDSVEDLVTDETKLSDKERQAIEHHIVQLRAAIARTLWSNEFYVGRSLLDDFVLHTAKNGGGDVPARVIAGLAAAGADRPGFVLYPLIGFGMEMPGIFAKASNLRSEAIFKGNPPCYVSVLRLSSQPGTGPAQTRGRMPDGAESYHKGFIIVSATCTRR